MLDLQLDPQSLADLELFLNGAYAPDPFFSLSRAEPFEPGEQLMLRDGNNVRLAEFTAVDGTRGRLAPIEAPRHADFPELRKGPAALQAPVGVALAGFPAIELEEALRGASGTAILHVLEDGPVDHFARVRAVQAMIQRYLDPARVSINILPALRPERAEQVLRNYGASVILAGAGESYRPEIAAIRDEAIPPRSKQGFCVWFTGLPSSGKSTIADQLNILLREGGRRVTMLDGDVVRTHLSKGLGFSREDRDANIRRVGFVAAEIVRHHGAVLAALVSPYQESRDAARAMVGENFVLVYVATPAEVCEERDVKGFYARARQGAMQGMTGVDDPYEAPTNAEIVLATTGTTPGANARKVLEFLRAMGFAAEC